MNGCRVRESLACLFAFVSALRFAKGLRGDVKFSVDLLGWRLAVFSRWIASLVALVLFLTLGLGCYETKTPLGSAANATVNRTYVGDFTALDKNNTVSIIIRNLDDKQYYVENSETGDSGKAPTRMVGYTTDVNGVTFANLRGLSDDGVNDDKFLIMRVSLSPDRAKLSLRNLKEEFFRGKDVSSSDALEKVIEANLDNEQMYDGQAEVFTRAAPTTQP
jgi:hypothetical protein